MNRELLQQAFREPHAAGHSRRDFIARCARAAFGLAVMPCVGGAWAGAAADPARPPGFGRAKRLIVINLVGGLSHIDSFDPKQGAAKGPAAAVATRAGFQLTSFLPQTAKVAGELTVIRSMAGKVGVHESAQYLMRTGFAPRGTLVHPDLGAWARHYLGPSHRTLPSNVCINRGAMHGNGFFPAGFSPLPIFDPDHGLPNATAKVGGATAQKRLDLLHHLDQSFAARVPDDRVRDYGGFYDETLKLMRGDDLEAFDLTRESAALRDAYGRNKLGQGCLLARRLTEHGVRYVEVSSGGWDMHNDLEDAMGEVGADFDTAFAALVTDLKRRGLLESTLVAVVTEFGRKPELDGSGRGHHPAAFSTVLAGGGAKRGFVYGATDAKGYAPTEKPVTVGELHATLAFAAGLPVEKAFKTADGRPMSVGDRAKPVPGVLA